MCIIVRSLGLPHLLKVRGVGIENVAHLTMDTRGESRVLVTKQHPTAYDPAFVYM